MNCPYCDESVHLMAKFCPKCGLPLKDDQTLMGGGRASSYDMGPNKWLIGGAAVAIIALALTTGFVISRATADRPTQMAREPGSTVGQYLPGPPGAGTLPRVPVSAAAPTYPATGFYNPAGVRAGQQPAVNWNPSVRWATPTREIPQLPPVMEEPVVLPPPVLATRPPQEPRQEPTVTLMPDLTPAIPISPDYLLAPVVSFGNALRPAEDAAGNPIPTLPGSPTEGLGPDGTSGGGLTPVTEPNAGSAGPRTSAYDWDPVHERWVLKPGRKPSSITGGYYENGSFFRPRQRQ